jgi:predicted DNA-binding protein
MTVTLELKPDLEQRLREQAANAGVPVEYYLLSLIEGAIPAGIYKDATLEEFEAAMDEFSEGTEDLPVLPPEAFSRESIYEGR